MTGSFPEESPAVAPRAELDPTDGVIPRALADDGADDPDTADDPSPEAGQLDTRCLHWTRALLEACQRLQRAD